MGACYAGKPLAMESFSFAGPALYPVAFCAPPANIFPMTEPLALLCYEKLAPGSQLVNRLQALRYRVSVVSAPNALQDAAEREKPMIVLAEWRDGDPTLPAAVSRLRQTPATAHIPVIVFTANPQAVALGPDGQPPAPVLVSETAILTHLPQLLERALTDF